MSSGQAPAGHTSSDKAELSIGNLKSYLWLGIITLIYFFDCADRVVVSSMFPAIKAEFKLSDFELGLLGNALGIVMAVLVVPMAAMVDKWSRKYMISIMVALWSGFTWACAWAGNFPQLLTFRALVGVGEAAYNPAGYALISAWFPQKMRALAVGIFTAAQPISGVLAMGLGGTLAMMYGWRGVLGIFALIQGAYWTSVLAMALYAYTIYSAAITPVVMSAFFWKRATAAGAVTSIALGTFVTIAWNYGGKSLLPASWAERDAIFPAMIVSLVSLVVVSLLTKAPRREQWAPFFDEQPEQKQAAVTVAAK
jgi:MFS family permease